MRVNNPDAALKLIAEWKEAVGSDKLEMYFPRLQNECGAIFYIRGDYVKAQEAYAAAYQALLERSDYPEHATHVARALNGRGLVRLMYHDYQQAKAFFQEGQALLAGADKGLEASLIFNLGLCYSELGELATALGFFYESLEHLPETALSDRSLRFNRIAKTYLDLGRLAEAEQALAALDLLEPLPLWEEAFRAATQAELAGAKRDTLRMHAFALRAYEQATEMGAIWDKSRALALLADATRTLQRWEETVHWQQELLAAKDSLMTRDKLLEIQDYEAKIAALEKEKLSDQLELFEAATKIKSLVIGVVVLLLLLLLGLFWFQRRTLYLKARQMEEVQGLYAKLQEAHADLQVQSERLAAVNQTKDKLFSLISHDIRSPLGILISYLRLPRNGGVDS
ncbi:histidine kinase [Nitritalea halalkaliphila LW7]|uniref:Histidine kinase n=1 Tax=Nitritalea halalkaliphila LW7 TaxID=1189621 RepID=I5C948_9BACT|nr:histidine kinase [Nitritalea halalkaliphila LW7]